MTETSTKPAAKPIPTRTKVLFFLVGWAIVLMPFLFWRATWFGRPLSDTELEQYIHDDAHPRHIQHALVQLGERITRHDKSAERWYPDLVRLSSSKVEEVRNTDAWVMGQDTSRAEFHAALLQLVKDPAFDVRSNAALSLVSYGDASGHDQIAAMLQPLPITAPLWGTVSEVTKPNALVTKGTLVAKVTDANGTWSEVRTPFEGRLHDVVVTNGQKVSFNDKLAVLDPGPDQVWEALRALYLIGTPADLDAVRRYERDDPDMPDRVREQARLTEGAITKRGSIQEATSAAALKCAAQTLLEGPFRQYLHIAGNTVQYRIQAGGIPGNGAQGPDWLAVVFYAPQQNHALEWDVNVANGHPSVYLFPDYLLRTGGRWEVTDGNGGPGSSERVRAVVEAMERDPIRTVAIPSANEHLPCGDEKN